MNNSSAKADSKMTIAEFLAPIKAREEAIHEHDRLNGFYRTVRSQKDIPALIRMVEVLAEWVEPQHRRECKIRRGLSPYCDCNAQERFDAAVSAVLIRRLEVKP